MKAAVYCRVSTDEQAEAKTIENQVDFAKRYCDLHEIEIYDFYLDDGITGTIAIEQRPEGARLPKRR
ncbi:MAG: recombinase family protein [Bacillota bacterium]|jgi:site-specific DNA recombinase|nr:recombinase family protein [Bacillota bacterium]